LHPATARRRNAVVAASPWCRVRTRVCGVRGQKSKKSLVSPSGSN
jgi:hypothetical protein